MSDAQQALLAIYRDAAGRMEDMPLYNAALSVELVAWQRVETGVRAGVIITPWCMNLIWLPEDKSVPPVKGERAVLVLPSGEYEGIAAQCDAIGWYGSASLLSQTDSLESQGDARALAQQIADLLFAVPEQPENLSRRAFFHRTFGQRATGGER